MYEFNPMGGGRIIRDKLWFYTSYRHIATDNTVPGMFVNRNAGNPNAWSVDFDRSKQAYTRYPGSNPVPAASRGRRHRATSST